MTEPTPAGMHAQYLLQTHGPMSRRELRDLAAAQMVTPAEIDKGCDELRRAGLARDVDGRLTLRE